MKLADLEGKKILIVGMGSEGQAAYRFLHKHLRTAQIKSVDQKDGSTYLDHQSDFDLAIKSPGVSTDKITIPFTTSTNIFFANFDGKTIGITGTKGKSTTAKLVYEILKLAKFPVSFGGNIGTPLLTLLEQHNNPESYAVCELSSYQLEGFRYTLDIAVFTNIFDAHLEHHGSRENYFAAKANIIGQADSTTYFVYNPEYPQLKALAQQSAAKQVPFEQQALTQPPQLPGQFNAANIRAAQSVAHILKIDDTVIKQAITAYEPLPHRLQNIGTFGGIVFYDDATSTTSESTIAALETLTPVETLLLGGQDVGYKFSGLVNTIIDAKVKNLVLFPDTGPKILKELTAANATTTLQILETTSMSKAITFAYQHTKPGGVCLLSNAAPSFTVWHNYLEKAQLFAKFVKQLAKK